MGRESYPSPLRLDVADILKQRAPAIPGFVARLLAAIICQDKLNDLLQYAFPASGADFCKAVLRHLDISLTVNGLDNIPPGTPLVFASNHPLGGLDGIALVAILGSRFGDDNIIFPVNDMLMHVRPLSNVFTPVNKYGRQGRRRADTLRQAFSGERHVIIFPAGLVSRLGKEGIRDLEWRKAFVKQAADAGRPIVPVRFEARNRMRFYRTARLRQKLHIPVNIEQVLLPSELIACRHQSFTITFLPAVDANEAIALHGSPRDAAKTIRESIYKQI